MNKNETIYYLIYSKFIEYDDISMEHFNELLKLWILKKTIKQFKK